MNRNRLMKFILALSILFSSTQSLADQQSDTQNATKHMVFSALVVGTFYGIGRSEGLTPTQSWLLGVSASVAVGIAKELTDKRFDDKDIGANLIGIGIVSIPILVLQF